MGKGAKTSGRYGGQELRATCKGAGQELTTGREAVGRDRVAEGVAVASPTPLRIHTACTLAEVAEGEVVVVEVVVEEVVAAEMVGPTPLSTPMVCTLVEVEEVVLVVVVLVMVVVMVATLLVCVALVSTSRKASALVATSATFHTTVVYLGDYALHSRRAIARVATAVISHTRQGLESLALRTRKASARVVMLATSRTGEATVAIAAAVMEHRISTMEGQQRVGRRWREKGERLERPERAGERRVRAGRQASGACPKPRLHLTPRPLRNSNTISNRCIISSKSPSPSE
jgi:hypothetical protein